MRRARYPETDGSYRTIFSNSVLEHIPDLLPVLVEQHRLLAPGGNFYVTIPTDRWERASLLARSLHALGLHEFAKVMLASAIPSGDTTTHMERRSGLPCSNKLASKLRSIDAMRRLI